MTEDRVSEKSEDIIELSEVDREIYETLFNISLSPVEKQIRYYKIIISGLCKLDDRFENYSGIELQLDKDSPNTYTVKVSKAKRAKGKRFKRARNALCGLVAPSVGALIAVFLRRCFQIP